ncbi:MetQ/NlpA family ABC transporter substrate-binding protein [Pelistega ratti]|uniref:MetQ/NlpA family ABC transporter substrate-binding protein n=1 Tax=Pelistega ratti TaxID=2652177 RepID=UPI00135ADF0C|nr:MetQ/NlpA family ABC transporter substrate-binding protein [Pelistega ratti]
MKLKQILGAFALASIAVTGAQAAKVSVAATPVPHAEILEAIKPTLAKEGVDLDIRVFTDYVQPNIQVHEKAIDANFFQHKPYLDSFNKDRGMNIVSVGNVHVEPFGAYSNKLKKGDEIPEGAKVAIPNDPSNNARALLLIEKQGLIKLKDPNNIFATAADITENPKKLKFVELEVATLPRVLDDVTFALINANYALEAGLNPVEQALFIEDANSPYANFLATLPENVDKPEIKALVKALQSAEVKKFIEDKYKGAVVPAF